MTAPAYRALTTVEVECAMLAWKGTPRATCAWCNGRGQTESGDCHQCFAIGSVPQFVSDHDRMRAALNATYAELLAQRDANAADARRYRFVRELSVVRSDMCGYVVWPEYCEGKLIDTRYPSHELLDAMIDAALSKVAE